MKRLSSWIIGMSVMFLVIVSYWMQPPILHRLELLSQNFHFKWRGPITPGNEVVIIAIDEKSLDELGRWPWPRDTIKTLVEKLVDHQVKVIGFDMVFSSPEESPELKKLILLKEELKSRKMLNQEIGQMLDRLIEESDHDADLA
ncbi:MAG: CHASE2 domain-containing protein, partial [Nitrospinales bacterium]